jgi:hypothetical protein
VSSWSRFPSPAVWSRKRKAEPEVSPQEFDHPSPRSGPTSCLGATTGYRVLPPSGGADVNTGCQRNSTGSGRTFEGSSGRSTQRHRICQPAHLHSVRQTCRPSSPRWERTKPPDFMGWLHSGQAGASWVMPRTSTEQPLRPGLSAEWPLRTGGLVSRSLIGLGGRLW